MRGNLLGVAIIVGVMGTALAADEPKAVDLAKIASDLRSDERATRFAALKLAEEMHPLPEVRSSSPS